MITFYKCRKFEMYVQWKTLLGFGFTFWILLCLCDYLFVSNVSHIVHKEEYDKAEIIEYLPEITPPRQDEGCCAFIKIIFWNILAFASTISICFLLKTMSKKLNIINNQAFLLEEPTKLTVRKTSSSKIPIPITNKTSSTDIHVEGINVMEATKESDCNKSCPNLFIGQAEDEKAKLESQGDKKIWSIRIMEKHCAKLREEMINLQATSLKEHSAITKRMENLNKEKRELAKQFNTLTRENKSLKQQLDEMIEERTLLIKKLECATKEMKTVTKNKKATVAKLDEAVANAETLKINLEQIKRDKVILQDKLIILDAEHKRLKEEMELYRQKEEDINYKLIKEKQDEEPVKEHVIDKYEPDIKENENRVPAEESDYDVFQSEEEMKRVQQKLLSLEKSLENFKLRHGTQENPDDTSNKINQYEWAKTDDNETEVPTLCLFSESEGRLTVEEQPSTTTSICTEVDCPLEHRECLRAECFLKRKSEDTDVSSSGEDLSQKRNYQEFIIKKKLPKLKSSISDDRLSVINERANTTGDDSADDWNEPRRRILSDTPAFQKFLREIIATQTKSESQQSVQEIT